MPAHAMPRQEIFPLKNQVEQGQPAYAYLHPETPAPQMLPEKEEARSPWRLHKPGLKKAVLRVKTVKVVAKAPQKEKILYPVKQPQPQKKKLGGSTEYLAANSG